MSDVVVVGAGVSGLTAATDLVAAGHSVRVLDKGRGVGGRLATRRLGGGRIDHGAQFFTTRSDEFVATTAAATDDGAVAEWCKGFGAGDGYPRYRGANGMSDLAKWMATDIDVELNTTVVDLAEFPADAYVLTSPIPQSLAIASFSKMLPPPEQHRTLARVDYHPVIALLATFDQPLQVPAPGGVQQPDDPVITFISDNQAKGISDVPALTLHASHQWSITHWLTPDDEVIHELLAAASDVLGDGSVAEVQLQRWRYAGPVTPWPDATYSWTDRAKGKVLALAGDAFANSKVEGAFLSGKAAAQAVISHLT